MTDFQRRTIASLEAQIEKHGSTKLLQYLLAEAKAGRVLEPKRAF